MTTLIALKPYAHGSMIGMRSSATPIRQIIETSLSKGDALQIDFSGVEVTQSFVDELIGAIILRQGEQIMSRITLKGCSSTTQGIIRFVANDRAKQFRSMHEFAPRVQSGNSLSMAH